MRIPKSGLPDAGWAPDLCHMALLDAPLGTIVEAGPQQSVQARESCGHKVAVVALKVLQCLRSGNGGQPVFARAVSRCTSRLYGQDGGSLGVEASPVTGRTEGCVLRVDGRSKLETSWP